jgi:hypothetical protein
MCFIGLFNQATEPNIDPLNRTRSCSMATTSSECGNAERNAAAIVAGSHGIGKGGLDLQAAVFWAFVGIPLGWGVWKTLVSAAKIF